MADLLGLASVAESAKGILGMFFPDKSEEEKAKLGAALALLQGQLEVNKVEAASPSMFVAGGRPAVIWVAAVALALTYWPKAIVLTIMWGYQAFRVSHDWAGLGPMPALPVFPDLGLWDLLGLLGSLLGVSTLRSIDKYNGVATVTTAKAAPQEAP